jgi:hypothetical protein
MGRQVAGPLRRVGPLPLVDVPARRPAGWPRTPGALSADQSPDLDRQRIGAARNGRRWRFLALLRDHKVQPIVVEHGIASLVSASGTSRPRCRLKDTSSWWWSLPRSMMTWFGREPRSRPAAARASSASVRPRIEPPGPSRWPLGRTCEGSPGVPVRARPPTPATNSRRATGDGGLGAHPCSLTPNGNTGHSQRKRCSFAKNAAGRSHRWRRAQA